MALLTAKALVSLILGVIALFGLWLVWNAVFSLLPQSIAVDTESYNFYKQVAKDINEIPINKQMQTPFKLKTGYVLLFLNPNNIPLNIKEKVCTIKSCLCLCQDNECNKVDCTILRRELKNSIRIASTGKGDVRVLVIKHDKDGISIEPKQ